MKDRVLVELARSEPIVRGDLPRAVKQITAVAARTLGVERSSVWLYDEGRTEIVCTDLYELSQDRHSSGTRLAAKDFPAYFAALEAERRIDADDARLDPRTREFTEPYLVPLGITSMLDAPIRTEGRVAGVICHEHVGPMRRWTAEELSFAATLADFVTIALESDRRRSLESQLLQAQKMEAIGELAGGVAHDFNNLLMVMRGNTELALQAVGSSPGAPWMREVLDACDRGSQLVRRLLAFASRQRMEPQVVDLNVVIAGMEQLLRRTLGEHIDLVVRPAAKLWPVRADASQIAQVVTNLAVNARDAMAGGGTLILATANATRDGGGPTPGECVRLEVRDTGTGMTPEVMARAFEPFFTTKEPGKGTGLGLAICYGIVRQSGGHIEVDSTVGQGTVFRVFLPRTTDAVPSEGQTVAPSTAGGTETILLVEDDPSLRRLLASVLRSQGYTVLTAGDGEEALRVAQRPDARELDLLLTDLVMPRMGGAELARRMKQERPELRVLYATGYGRKADLEPGAEVVQKPVATSVLARRIRQLLDRA